MVLFVGALLGYASLVLSWQAVGTARGRLIAIEVSFGDLGALGVAYLLGLLALIGAVAGRFVAPAVTGARLRMAGVVGLIAALAALVLLTTRVVRFPSAVPGRITLLRQLLGTEPLTVSPGPGLYAAWFATTVLGGLLLTRGAPAAGTGVRAARAWWYAAAGAGWAGLGLVVASVLAPWHRIWALGLGFDVPGPDQATTLSFSDQRYWAVGYVVALLGVIVAAAATALSRPADGRAYAVTAAAFAAGAAVLAATVAVRWPWALSSSVPASRVPMSWALGMLGGAVQVAAGPYLAVAGAALLGAAPALMPGRQPPAAPAPAEP